MKNIKGLLFAIISSATFGFIPLFSVPLLKNGVDLNSVCFYRFLFSSIMMGLFLLFKNKNFSIKEIFSIKKKFGVTKKEFVNLFLLSFFYASTSIFLTGSYAYMPTGIATTIHFLYPVLVTLLMIFFFKEQLSKMKAIAILLAIAGVFFLCGGLQIISGGALSSLISFTGIGLVLVTVVTYSVYIVGVNNSPILMNMDAMKMTFYVLTFSAFFFLCNILVRGGDFSPLTTLPNWSNVIALALIATLISDLALIFAIQLIGSTTTAILGCMEPLTAVIMGILFLGESLNPTHIIGIVLVFIAVYIIIKAKERA